jgi:hypothetical protein
MHASKINKAGMVDYNCLQRREGGGREIYYPYHNIRASEGVPLRRLADAKMSARHEMSV